MKKISKKDIIEALKKFQSSEPEYDGTIVYYLHTTEDGEIVSDHADADETYTATLPEEAYIEYPADYDWRDDVESENNPYFMEVVERLYEQANS